MDEIVHVTRTRKGLIMLKYTCGDTFGKVIKTNFLVLAWVCLALMQQTTGPTLLDLKARSNSNYEDLATALAGQSAGYVIGAVTGGLLVDKLGLFCELLVALCLDGMAVATTAIPWAPWTQLIWFLCCLQGFFAGILNTAGMKLVFKMWQEKAASPMHLLHGGYGIGSFIIPLIANPFLAVPAEKDENSTNYDNITVLPLNANISADGPNTGKYLKPSRIEYAFLIPSVIGISLSLVFHAYNILNVKRRRYLKANSQMNEKAKTSFVFKQILNPATCAEGNFVGGLTNFILLILFYGSSVGKEVVAGTFIRAFSIDYYEFSVDDGSYINTTFWISFSVGRILGFLTARWIPIRILLLIEICGVLLSDICLATVGGKSPTALWVIVQPLAFFIGPLYPSGMGWANYHMQMTGVGIAVLIVGAAIGVVATMKLTGYLYDTFGPLSYLYTLLGLGITSFVISVLMYFIGFRKGGKIIQDSEVTKDLADDTVNHSRYTSSLN